MSPFQPTVLSESESMRIPVSLAACLICLPILGPSLVAEDEDEREDVKTLRVVIENVKPIRGGTALFEKYGLTRDDYRRIAKLAGDRPITAIREVPHKASAGEKSVMLIVIGTSPDYARLAGGMEQGRFLAEKDLKQLNNVAVINQRAAKSLFPDANPVGENVRVGKNYYLIVGVAKEGFGRVHENRPTRKQVPAIYIPISTMRSRIGDRVLRRGSGTINGDEYELSRIEVDVPVAEADRLSVAIRRLLQKTHESKDYQIQIHLSQSDRRTP